MLITQKYLDTREWETRLKKWQCKLYIQGRRKIYCANTLTFCASLTWYRYKELDSIPVSVERKLRLRHGAVGDETLCRQLIFAICIDPDSATWHNTRLLFQRILDGGALLHWRRVRCWYCRRVVQRHWDDNPVASAHPQAEVGDEQGRYANEGEAKLPCAWNSWIRKLQKDVAINKRQSATRVAYDSHTAKYTKSQRVGDR